MENFQFEDRFDAGRILAERLSRYANRGDVVILGLPRGGVPVAVEVADALNAPFDIFLVRKLGVPGYEELALGAIASGGVCVFNTDVIQHLQLSPGIVKAVVAQEARELERRELLYRGHRRPLPLAGQHLILVDDGLATGASMRAAIQALRQRKPASIIVAVPVASRDICAKLEAEADEVVCARTPEPLQAVGLWYQRFQQLSDEEVSTLLNRAASERQPSQSGIGILPRL